MMSKSIIPLRFRVLHYASENDAFGCYDLLRDLEKEYGTEGQFKKGMMTLHLDSLRAVGMLEVANVDFGQNNELLIQYNITDYGRSRLSYLPADWK